MKKLILCVFALVCMSVQTTVHAMTGATPVVFVDTTGRATATYIKITLTLTGTVGDNFESTVFQEVSKAGCISGLKKAGRVDRRTFIAYYQKGYSSNAFKAADIAVYVAQKFRAFHSLLIQYVSL